MPKPITLRLTEREAHALFQASAKLLGEDRVNDDIAKPLGRAGEKLYNELWSRKLPTFGAWPTPTTEAPGE
jgi:hypothetical protein